MKNILYRSLSVLLLMAACSSEQKQEQHVLSTAVRKSDCKVCLYPWLDNHIPHDALEDRILAPAGYSREAMGNGGYAQWLRHFPVKKGVPHVKLYNGTQKIYQSGHCAILDIDVGTQDLQQCADAVMRIRAEYLYSKQLYNSIHFKFTSGDDCAWPKWKEGYRPVINGNKVQWAKKGKTDGSYKNFRNYMNMVFQYAGSASLSKELKFASLSEIKPGDVFIQGGFPGHAVQVMDVVINADGKKLFLLAQSYMPAQDIHVLVNPNNAALSPWYEIPEGELETPEWTFAPNSLKRFAE